MKIFFLNFLIETDFSSTIKLAKVVSAVSKAVKQFRLVVATYASLEIGLFMVDQWPEINRKKSANRDSQKYQLFPPDFCQPSPVNLQKFNSFQLH